MNTKQKIPKYLELIKCHATYLEQNAEAFDIYQGNLLPYVEADLAKQLNPKSFQRARWRIPPINVLKRIVDKLSKIYHPGPVRTVEDGGESEQELLAWYTEHMRANTMLNIGDEHFNLFKCCLLEPYVDGGKPRLRVIPADRFIPYSENRADDTVPTGYVICKGKVKHAGREVELYMGIEAEDFCYFIENGDDVTAVYAPETNKEGVNTYGVLPYVYVNRSVNGVMPVQDSDTLRMTKLIPLLLTDANLIALFQAYSVFYGINVDDSNMTWGPDTFLSFRTDPGSPEAKPEVGVLTPSQNVDGTLNLVASQLAFWLNSRGIRPGAIGEITATNFQSGISKMIDEMDTSEDRAVQVDFFSAAEAQLWELVFQHMHPVWKAEKLIETQADWKSSAYVKVTFPDQLPPLRRGEVIVEVTNELAAGLTTKERAIKRLNPDMTEAEVDELMQEVGGGFDDGAEPGEPALDENGQPIDQAAALAGGASNVPGIQRLSLNGAQVESLLQVITQTASGFVPKTAAKAIIAGAFAIDQETIDAIIDPIEVGSISAEPVATPGVNDRPKDRPSGL